MSTPPRPTGGRHAPAPRETPALAWPGDEDRLVQGDALAVLAALPAGRADLVYVDPPFYTGRRMRGRGAPAARSGSTAASEGSASAAPPLSFEDRWEGGLGQYLDWLAALLEQAHRALRRTGSLFLHLDWHAAHAARLLLDALFGPRRFVNEIIWHYGSGGRARRHFPRKHDTLLWYARGSHPCFYPDAVGVPRNRCPACGQTQTKWNHLRRHTDADGRVYRTIRSGGKLYRYYDDEPTLPPDVWLDLSHLQQRDPERVGWPTQKPESLLRRILRATTAAGDLVVDPCCGSGTTGAVSRALGRRFFGIDRSAEAIALATHRLGAPPDPDSCHEPARRPLVVTRHPALPPRPPAPGRALALLGELLGAPAPSS
jgi:site-specific DNA-methyltransferase (adenine-specific)/adenine-specific DNA-methyltransferase